MFYSFMVMQIDDLAFNEYEKQMSDLQVTREKIVEREKRNTQREYRQFLLQQIEDKERSKAESAYTSSEVRGNAYTYSEELITPEG